MSTIRAAGLGTLTASNTATIVDPATPTGGNAYLGPVVNMAVVNCNTTNATSYDFIGIPAWTKRITIVLNGVKKSSTANFLVQIGSGSILTSGYSAYAGYVGSAGSGSITSTAGFNTAGDAASTVFVMGTIILYNIPGTTLWMSTLSAGSSNSYGISGGGNVNVGGTLDRVRVTTTSGTDIINAGYTYVIYE
jgi:hypothetical protein